MTEEEIIELQKKKAKELRDKHAEVDEEYFRQKFEREKLALQRREFERL